MFEKIKKWLKDMVNKMIGKKDIKQVYGADTIITDLMANKIKLWSEVYTNKSPWLTSEIKSMNLGAAVSSELSRLVTLEFESEIDGSPRAEFLNEQYKKVLAVLRQQVEYGLAKGGIVFKPYVSNDKVVLDYVQADRFFPISIDSTGLVTEAVFWDQVKKGDNQFYNKLEYHKYENGSEFISNSLFFSNSANDLGKQIPLESFAEYQTVMPEIILSGLETPTFAYFKNPSANTVEPGNPIGISIFEKSIDKIKEADKQWSRFLWENESGERALYVDSGAFKKDEFGNMLLPNQRLYRALESAQSESLFKDWTPELRNNDLLSGLDAILKKIEFSCGLAYGTISDPQVTDKTATEVKQARQRSWSTVKDIQNNLEECLASTIYIMDYLTTLYGLAPSGTYDVSYSWDDSIITDKDADKLQDKMDVSSGLMAKWEYRMKWYGETEEQAKSAIADIQSASSMGAMDLGTV